MFFASLAARGASLFLLVLLFSVAGASSVEAQGGIPPLGGGGGAQPMCGGCPQYAVQVTPDNQASAKLVENTANNERQFVVKNNGLQNDDYTLMCSGTNVSCTSVTPSSLSLPASGPGQEDTVTVVFSVTTGTTATLMLTALSQTEEEVSNAGSYIIPIQRAGGAIAMNVFPPDSASMIPCDSVFSLFVHPTGVNTSTRKIWIDGNLRNDGPDSLITTTSYDAVGRVGTVINMQKDTLRYRSVATSWSKVDDVRAATDSAQGTGIHTLAHTYSSDGLRRLITSTRTGTPNTSHIWTYDVFGNAVREQTSGPSTCSNDSLTVGPDNRLERKFIISCSALSSSRYYTDQAGNRLGQADTVTGVSVNLSAMTYTPSGQLYHSVAPDRSNPTLTEVAWHHYDAAGLRVITRLIPASIVPSGHSMDGANKTMYFYDGSDVTLAVRVNGFGQHQVYQRFLNAGVDRQLAVRLVGTGGSRSVSVLSDRGGTTLKLLKGDGAAECDVSTAYKSPYGAMVVPVPGCGESGETGFAGASTPGGGRGFTYLRNRWYDPNTGRFLTQDPIGLAGGVNLYEYAGSNPIAFDDPFGLDPCKDRGITDPFVCTGALLQPIQKPLEVAGTIVINIPLLGAPAAAPAALRLGTPLATRANQIHAGLSGIAATMRTTAVAAVRNPNGTLGRLVASSERALAPAQRALMETGEQMVSGLGHAEAKIVAAAAAAGQKVLGIAASRPICPVCAQVIRDVGARIGSVLK